MGPHRVDDHFHRAAADVASAADHPDHALAELARRQHGVVARWQCVLLGLSDTAIKRRLAARRLHRLHRGVFSVGHRRISATGRTTAALLACGSEAVLSHMTAAAWWGLASAPGTIHVTVPRAGGRRAHTDVRVHRATTLLAAETTVYDGLPVTTVARTLLDAAGATARFRLDRAFERADTQKLLDGPTLHAVLAAHPHRRGAPALRAALADWIRAPSSTLSDFEAALRTVIRTQNVPEPSMNVVVHGICVDAYWPRYRLIVEADSFLAHGTWEAARKDRARDAHFARHGIITQRFTFDQVHEQPGPTAQAILTTMRDRTALAPSTRTGPP